MKIALPVQGEVLDQHFGHCKEFVFVEVSDATRTVMSLERYPAPMHEHGLLPRWLAEHKVQVVIVGGMGAHARQLLVSLGIEVISGAASAGRNSWSRSIWPECLSRWSADAVMAARMDRPLPAAWY